MSKWFWWGLVLGIGNTALLLTPDLQVANAIAAVVSFAIVVKEIIRPLRAH